jgi:hypothetical protein
VLGLSVPDPAADPLLYYEGRYRTFRTAPTDPTARSPALARTPRRRPRAHHARALLLAGAALAAAGLLGTGVAAAASADEVPRGTVVRDVELGGLTRSEAVDRLDGSLTAERTTPVSLLAGGESLSLDPSGRASSSTSRPRWTTRWTPVGPAGCGRWSAPSGT